jgi:hypothetical protein
MIACKPNIEKEGLTAVSPKPVDRGMPFFPAEHTALYYTSIWQELSVPQQLRYTQLYGLYVNEQTAFFEESLARTVLPALYKNPNRIGTQLAESLKEFEMDERRHTNWFRELNHRIAPDAFSLASNTYHFIKIPGWQAKLTAALSRRPWLLPCWVWVMLIQEERSIFISRSCIHPSAGIEPHFVDLHRKHLADEVHHVRWDLELIDVLWNQRSRPIRTINAHLFQWMMSEFFTAPKRAARAVVNQLVEEHADLSEIHGTLLDQLADLQHNRAYHASLYDREKLPQTFALFDQSPEFARLENTLLAYDRQSVD